LNPNPITTITSATINSGSSARPASADAIAFRFVAPLNPYSRLSPNSMNAAAIPPNRKYFNAASADFTSRLLNAVRMYNDRLVNSNATKIIRMSSALTRNIIPTVASRMSAKYSPTCAVKSESTDTHNVNNVSASRPTLTSCVSGSATSIPCHTSACAGITSSHATAAVQPTLPTIAPMTRRRRASLVRIVKSAINTESAATTRIVSGTASRSVSR